MIRPVETVARAVFSFIWVIWWNMQMKYVNRSNFQAKGLFNYIIKLVPKNVIRTSELDTPVTTMKKYTFLYPEKNCKLTDNPPNSSRGRALPTNYFAIFYSFLVLFLFPLSLFPLSLGVFLLPLPVSQHSSESIFVFFFPPEWEWEEFIAWLQLAISLKNYSHSGRSLHTGRGRDEGGGRDGKGERGAMRENEVKVRSKRRAGKE